jgi:hypothetical protein
MLSNTRRAISFAAFAILTAGFALPGLAQETDDGWIPFYDPAAPATQTVQVTQAAPKTKSAGAMTVGATSFSGTAKQPWDEYDKVVQASGVIGALGPDLFGDTVEYYKNTLSFSVTDISLPGNCPCPWP